jgi:hypothetical protein
MRRAEAVDVLYVCCHGRLKQGNFEVVMHADDWAPATSGLDGNGPLVAVFDACNLLDPSDPSWDGPWASQPRPRLRLVLGFASLATVNKAAALRGEDFADRLARGDPVAGAWLAAVRSHDAHGRDRPVAVAFGASASEAYDLLHTLSYQGRGVSI